MPGWLSSIAERLLNARRKVATGALGLLALWLFLHVMTSQNGIIHYNKKRAEYRQLQEQIRLLEQENKALEDKNRALQQNDPKLVEKEAREQLRYAKPGEVVYIMPEPPKPAAPEQHPTATAEKKQ